MDFDPEEIGVREMVSFPVLCSLLDQYSGEDLKEACQNQIDDLIPRHITVADIMASINPNSAISFCFSMLYKSSLQQEAEYR